MEENKIKFNKSYDMSRREAAELLSMSVQTITNYVEQGLLSARKRGRFLWFCREEVMTLLPVSKDVKSAEQRMKRAEQEYLVKARAYEAAIRRMTVNSRFRDSIESKITKDFIPGIIACFTSEDIFDSKSSTGKRTIDICLDYFSGMRIIDIAKKYNMSREGVRQIVKKSVNRISSIGTIPQMIGTIRELRKEIISQKDIISMLKSQNAEIRTIVGMRPDNSQSQVREDILNKQISELGLSVRASNCCRAAGIATLRGLCQYTYDDIKSMHLVGNKTVEELSNVLKEHGLSFRKPENKYFETLMRG